MSAKSDGPPLPAEPDAVDPEPALDEAFYTSSFRDRPLIKPSVPVSVVGILADPGEFGSLIGIAYATTHVGGVKWDTPYKKILDVPPPELVWRLELDRYWSGGRTFRLVHKRTLDGRFVLRLGRFVELAEDAV